MDETVISVNNDLSDNSSINFEIVLEMTNYTRYDCSDNIFNLITYNNIYYTITDISFSSKWVTKKNFLNTNQIAQINESNNNKNIIIAYNNLYLCQNCIHDIRSLTCKQILYFITIENPQILIFCILIITIVILRVILN